MIRKMELQERINTW